MSAYEYDVRQLLTQRLTDELDIYFENTDAAEATGVEVEVNRRFDSGAMLRASYSAQRAVDGTTREDLSSSPQQMAKVNLSLPFFGERLYTGFELQYQSEAWTLAGNRADDFLTANVTLFSRPMDKGFELSGTIYNVFDEDYGYPGAGDHLQDVILQDGRTFLGRLTYRF